MANITGIPIKHLKLNLLAFSLFLLPIIQYFKWITPKVSEMLRLEKIY